MSASPARTVNGIGAEAGGRSGGRGGFVRGDVDGELVPEETFLDSLHLDRDQMFDFCNSEGHFLYLRQKPGTDATAYNLEVILTDLHDLKGADDAKKTYERRLRARVVAWLAAF